VADQDFNPFEKPDLIRFSPRYRRLDKLSRIFDGRQYEGRPDWWTGIKQTGDTPVPLRQRKPCIVYKLPKAAVRQVVNFLWGDGRWPAITVPSSEEQVKPKKRRRGKRAKPGEASETEQPNPVKAQTGVVQLSDDEAEAVQQWLDKLIERARIKPRQRALSTKGIATGTCIALLYLRNGELQVDLPQPQDCWAEFVSGDPDSEVERLVWCYEFDKTVIDPITEKPTTKRYLYRRDWDREACHVFEDVELKVDQKKIEWREVLPAKPHGLSFCPVIWIRNDPESGSGIDGVSIYEGSEDEIETLDQTASIRYRGIAYLGTPQLVETAEQWGETPDTQQVASGPAGFSAPLGGDSPHGQMAPRNVRKFAPNEIWHYEGQKVDVKIIEAGGQAYDLASKHLSDIRNRLLEGWSVVLSNLADQTGTSTTAQEMSAKFLALAHAPLLGLVSSYRNTWWSFSLERLLQMSLRICVDLDGKGIMIPGSEEVASIGKRFYQTVADDDGQPVRRWLGPTLEPTWGRFFDPSDKEIGEAVGATKNAREAKLVTLETAITQIADDFCVADVQREIEELDEEQELNDARAADDAQRELDKLTELAHGRPGATPPGSREDSPKATGNRSGAPAPATTEGPATGTASRPVGGKGNAQPVAG
jgi:hypothetical protein